MPNFTPATATAIPSLPYTVAVDLSASPDDATYVPQGALNSPIKNSGWWAYTALVGDDYLAVRPSYVGAAADAVASVAIWVADPALPDLTQFFEEQGQFLQFITIRNVIPEILDVNVGAWLVWPVTVGRTYFLQVFDDRDPYAAPTADLGITVERAPRLQVPAGSTLIPDDAQPYPAVAISPTGTLVRTFAAVTSTEVGDTLATGEICTVTLVPDDKTLRVYSNQLALVTETATATPVNVVRAVNGIWYLLLQGGLTKTIRTVTTTGVLSGVLATLDGVTDVPTKALAVSPDATIAYWVKGPTPATIISRHDLVHDVPLSDLVDVGMGADIGDPDMACVSTDGSVLVRNGAVTILRYSAAGALLSTYAVGETGYVIDRYCVEPAGLAFWAWLQSSDDRYPQMAIWKRMRVSDGTVLAQFPLPRTDSGRSPDQAIPFTTASSCPILFLVSAIPPPPPPTARPADATAPCIPCAGWTPQRVRITGSELPTPAIVTLTDPNSETTAAYVESSSATEIIIVHPFPTCGTWTITIAGVPPFTVATCAECACCMSTKTNLINEALLKIGVSQTIANLAESSREAYTGTILFDKVLLEVLREFPWGFATKYAKATDASTGDPMELVGGSVGTPFNADWQYAYRYPSDCVYARRIVPVRDTGRLVNRAPIPFRVGRTTTEGDDADYLLVYTNQPDAELEYTMRVECAEHFADALFEDALSWKLAGKLAPSLSRIDGLVDKCLAAYALTLETARAVANREHQLATPATLVTEALLKIGVTTTIAANSEPSREAATGTALLSDTLLEVLREFPWAFASKKVALSGVEGSTGSPIDGDWIYRYSLPDDCVTARRIVPPRATGRSVNRAPVPFRVGRTTTGGATAQHASITRSGGTATVTAIAHGFTTGDLPTIAGAVQTAYNGVYAITVLTADTFSYAVAGTPTTPATGPITVTGPIASDDDVRVLYTNQADAVLEYTMLVEDPEYFTDPLFRDVVAWKLASKLAPALGKDPALLEKCLTVYAATLETAKIASARESQLATLSTLVTEALLKIGVPTTIAEQSPQAATGAALLDDTLAEVLRQYPWPFATKYARSADASTGDPMELLDGSETSPVNGDWTYMYRLPDDCLFARRLVSPTGLGRRYDPAPLPFRLGRTTTNDTPDPDVRVLFTNAPDAVLEYTMLVGDPEYYSDPLFREAVAWKLAAKLSPTLSPAKNMLQVALALYDRALAVASTASAREQQQEPPGDADWITGR